MLVRQRLLRSAPALTFLLVNLFLALSLGGYDPADAPGSGAEPPNHSPHLSNPCGPVGATLAHAMFVSLGWASWLALVGLVAVNVLIVSGRRVPDRAGPVLGFGLVLAVSSGLIQKFTPVLWPSPPVGSGGYVGALVSTFLFNHFGPYGMLLIMVAAGASGLVLCHDVVFTWPVQEATAWIRSRLGRRRAGKGAGLRPGDGLMVPSSAGEWSAPGPIPEGLPMRPAVTRAALPPIVSAEAAILPAGIPATPTPQVPGTGPRAASVPALPGSAFQLPPREMLEPPVPFPIQDHETKVHARAMLLERTLLDFGYQVRVVQIDTGPVITQYEIELEAGLRGLADHEPGRRPGDRAGGAERPHRGADSRQDDRRHRGPQRPPRHGPPGRGDRGPGRRTPRNARSPSSSARTSRACPWSSTWPTCPTC